MIVHVLGEPPSDADEDDDPLLPHLRTFRRAKATAKAGRPIKQRLIQRDLARSRPR